LNENGKAFKLNHYLEGMQGSVGGHSLFSRAQVSKKYGNEHWKNYIYGLMLYFGLRKQMKVTHHGSKA